MCFFNSPSPPKPITPPKPNRQANRFQSGNSWGVKSDSAPKIPTNRLDVSRIAGGTIRTGGSGVTSSPAIMRRQLLGM